MILLIGAINLGTIIEIERPIINNIIATVFIVVYTGVLWGDNYSDHVSCPGTWALSHMTWGLAHGHRVEPHDTGPAAARKTITII